MNTTAHFSGELVRADTDETLGLHRLTLQLVDDDGHEHHVYIAHGRGDDARQRCMAQHAGLQIGRRYHGSAQLKRHSDAGVQWFGLVSLQPDQRRPRFELVIAERLAQGARAC